MYTLCVSQLERNALNRDNRYVFEIKAEVLGQGYPQVCNRQMAISISMATNPATKIPNNVTAYVTQDDHSSFPDLETAITAIKRQFKANNLGNEFSFMLGDDAVRFLLALHKLNGYDKETFDANEINSTSEHLVNGTPEDMICELETSGRDVVETHTEGHISVNWDNARWYFKIKEV